MKDVAMAEETYLTNFLTWHSLNPNYIVLNTGLE